MIELLVVLVAIAVLAALLIPALSAARERARSKQTVTVSGTAQPTQSSASTWIEDPQLLLLLLASCFALAAYTYQQFVSHFSTRAQLAIVRVLSDRRPRSFDTLCRDARTYCRSIAFTPGLFTDALFTLLSKQHVSVNNDRFTIATSRVKIEAEDSDDVSMA